MTIQILPGTLDEEIAESVSTGGTAGLYDVADPQNITVASQTIIVTDGIVDTPITSDADYTLTATPAIDAGRDGQIVVLINEGSHAITLQDEAFLAGGGFRLQATTRTLDGGRGQIGLMYDEAIGEWMEQWYSDAVVFVPAVTAFTVNGATSLTREVGSSGVDTVPTFAMSYLGTPSAASIDVNSGKVSPSDYPLTINSPFTSGTGAALNRGTTIGASHTFTVTATVSGTGSLTRSVIVVYYNRVYLLKSTHSTAAALTDTEINLAANSSIQNSVGYSTSSVPVTGAGEYLWYLFPSRMTYNTITFYVGSQLPGGMDGAGTNGTVISHTNQYGYTEDYRAFRADNPALGAMGSWSVSVT